MTDISPRQQTATAEAVSARRRRAGVSDGYSIDPNEAVKTTVTTLLGEIPEVGGLLGGLVDILWPTGTSDNVIWNSMEAKVEALVNQKIADSVYNQTQADLEGLENVSKNYRDSAKPGHTPAFTSENWTAARGEFAQRMPHFRFKGAELLLLPLWAQAANMHLSLLRDGVLFGQTWGWNDTDHDSVVTELQAAITDYTAWAQRIFGWGTAGRLGTVNYHQCEPFRSTNAFHQQMVPGVLDLADRWPLFDPTKYAPPANPEDLYLTREIYSTPWGTADDSGLFVLPWQHPAQPPTQITVWSEPNLIDAVQVTYPDGAGPDGVSKTARMGANKGNATTINIAPGNPVTTVDVWGGDVVQGLQFTFKDGTTTAHFGSSAGTRGTFDFYQHKSDPTTVPSGRILSSIYVNGVSNYYNCIDAIVFGFRYEP